MLIFWLVVWRTARSLLSTVNDSEFRPVLGLVFATVTVGSVFYWRVEQWSLIDAAYFSVVTLATVGFGDLSPQTTLGKLFTMAYILIGAGILGIFVNSVARRSMRQHRPLRQFLESREEPEDEVRGKPPGAV